MNQGGQITVSKYFISRIEDLGVPTIPVIQGGAIMKLIDDLGQSKKLKYICPNHEQALAMMVDAYARVKGFGVGMATSGPGGINLATGIACAYYDSVPCMFITGQVGMFHVKGNRAVRQRGFQETDIVNIVKPITKYAVLLENPEDARYELEKALHLAKSGRPGPVLIDIPYNVQRALINPENLRGYESENDDALDKKLAKSASKEILKELKRASRPLILAGGGARISGQSENVRKLVKLLGMPIVTTWGAIDFFEPDFPLYGGNIGRVGNHSANKLVQRSDFLLSLGCRFTTKEIIDEKRFAKDAKIVSVDIDRGELEEGLIDPNTKLRFDLGVFIPELLNNIKGSHNKSLDDWINEFKKIKTNHFSIDATRPESVGAYVSPYKFGRALSATMPPRATLISDCGVNLMWMAQSFAVKPGQRFMSAWGCSPMGYALPASLGAQLADKDGLVVVTVGDGGMQMNIQELQTLAFSGLPIKIFVFNNGCYISIKHPAKEAFEGRAYATDEETGYKPPDFVKVARAYGIKALTMKAEDNLEQKLKGILAMPGPVITNVPVDPEQFVFENGDLIPQTPK